MSICYKEGTSHFMAHDIHNLIFISSTFTEACRSA